MTAGSSFISTPHWASVIMCTWCANLMGCIIFHQAPNVESTCVNVSSYVFVCLACHGLFACVWSWAYVASYAFFAVCFHNHYTSWMPFRSNRNWTAYSYNNVTNIHRSAVLFQFCFLFLLERNQLNVTPDDAGTFIYMVSISSSLSI